MFGRGDVLYSPSHASGADEPGGYALPWSQGEPRIPSSMVQGGASMTRAVLAGMLVLGLAAYTGGAAKAARDGAPPEQLLAGGTRVSATIQDSLSSRASKTGDMLHAIVSGDVKGPHGGVVIPAGSSARLTIALLEPGNDQRSPEGRLSLVVSSVTVNGEQYPVSADLDPVPHHLQVRTASTDQDPGGRSARRDVVVSAGTPIVFALTNSPKVSAR